MIVAVGFDHAGLPLRDVVIETIEAAGHEVIDHGARELDPDDDYPDYARPVGESILAGKAERGVVVCGSGVGIAVAACKMPDVRAALCHDTFSARQGVEDDAMNVLALGARVIGPSLAAELVRTFLAAEFSGADRHRRRLAKTEAIEAAARAGAFDTDPREGGEIDHA